MTQWHGESEEISFESFETFLYDSPVETIEFSYRDAVGTLLAVGLCDVCPESLSSVYFYFDPAHASRGLGRFGALYELEYARLNGIPYYYLGHWINGCRKMEYKNQFGPHELLGTDGVWRRAREGPNAGP